MAKSALIVDDSPVARRVLSRLLNEYGLNADTAPSAKSALDYLKHKRPDVIFMDHLMPGMDGFEALGAIKANPVTATIPVMMYTAQEGALYVSQARALGAFGVLPKDLQPIEVARVLRALRLIPEETSTADPPDTASGPSGADAARVKELLEELFYQQRAALREEIRESYQQALATTKAQPTEDFDADRSGGQSALLGLAAAILLGLTLLFAYLYATTHELLSQSNEALTRLAESSADPSAGNAPQMPANPAANSVDTDLFAIIEAALNLSGEYPFAEIPLDGARGELIGRAVPVLERAGFSGVIDIDVHVGQFCMNATSDGDLVLAPPEQLATECAQIGWPALEAASIVPRQSLAFANTVASATHDKTIQVSTVSYGSEQPITAYPQLTGFVSAGEWNAIAQRNHRVALRLLPDTRSTVPRGD